MGTAMVQGSRKNPAQRFLWEKEEQRSKRAFAGGGSEGCAACDDAAGPVIVYGTVASVIYGVVLMLFG